jgi:hypothetical protein
MMMQAVESRPRRKIEELGLRHFFALIEYNSSNITSKLVQKIYQGLPSSLNILSPKLEAIIQLDDDFNVDLFELPTLEGLPYTHFHALWEIPELKLLLMFTPFSQLIIFCLDFPRKRYHFVDNLFFSSDITLAPHLVWYNSSKNKIYIMFTTLHGSFEVKTYQFLENRFTELCTSVLPIEHSVE